MRTDLRTVALGGVVLAALGVGAWLLGADRSGPTGNPREGDMAAPSGVGEGLEAPRGRERAITSMEDAGAPEVATVPTLDPVAEEPSAGLDPREDAFWRLCLSGVEDHVARACIQRELGGRVVSPEELVQWICADGPPEGGDYVLIDEVAAGWDPAHASQHIARFQSLCDVEGHHWIPFLARQGRVDPEWLAAFEATLDPASAFRDEDFLQMRLLMVLRDSGSQAMAQALDAGARGEWGGGAEQVALALASCFESRRGSETQLEFLRSVLGAPTFEHRPAEVRALAGCVLEGAVMGRDPQLALAFVDELLAHPAAGPEFARHLVDLHQRNRMPAGLSEVQRQTLLRRARALL